MTARRHRASSGFSLIELLVVLALVGAALATVAPWIAGDSPANRVSDEVEKFVAQAEFASEMAVVTGDPIGLMMTPPAWQDNPDEDGWQYGWRRMTREGWTEMDKLEDTELERDLVLDVRVYEQPWTYENAPEVREPLVVFYPEGEVTPFTVVFTHDLELDIRETVELNLWGDVVWKEKQEALEQAGQ